jgi:predicted nucleic-acid-binding protein
MPRSRLKCLGDMTAVDTNVVVRLLTGDHPSQSAVARSVFAAGPIWIAKTVFLETAWVLSSVYRFDESAIRSAFTKLLGLENVQIEDDQSVEAALALTTEGLEIADAIHLTSRPPEAQFVTFDRQLIRLAHRAGVKKVSNAAVNGS